MTHNCLCVRKRTCTLIHNINEFSSPMPRASVPRSANTLGVGRELRAGKLAQVLTGTDETRTTPFGVESC